MLYNVLSVVSFAGVCYLCLDKYIKYRKDYKRKQLFKDTYKRRDKEEDELTIDDLYENGLITEEQYEDYKSNRIRFKPRRDSIDMFTKINPILREGEIVVVYGNDGEVFIKIGNGKECFNDLPYVSTPSK